MEPHSVFDNEYGEAQRRSALEFWNRLYGQINDLKKNDYVEISSEDIESSYAKYVQRIHKSNSAILMKVLRTISPIKIFKPVEIFLHDKNISVWFDYVSKDIRFIERQNPMLTMSSESLNFLFQNSFGFDTLTVNGCFEEAATGGFLISTKTLAIENLNNLGMSVSLRTLLKFTGNYVISKTFI